MPLDLPDDELAAFLRTADAPAPLYDLMGLLACHAAVAALRLGVFDALASRPGDLADLADRTGTDPAALRILLRALTEVGYLDLAAGTYANAPTAARWLADGGPWSAALPFWVAMVGAQWSDLDASIRTGKPAAGFYPWLDRHPLERELFHGLQGGLGAGLAAALTEVVEIPADARRMTDVGGGEATFSIALCTRHPGLTATVLDRPSVVAAGADRIAAAGLADRITVRGADLALEHAFDLDEPGQDVVLLCNVVHGFPADRARSLVDDCVRALRPGGTLLLLETADRPRGASVSRVDQAFNRFFDLNLWLTQGGRIHPVETLLCWLVEAGCRVRRTDLPGFPTHVLLVAESAP